MPHVRVIPNAELTLADIPADDVGWEWPGIPAFAATFDGDSVWGSLEKCFEIDALTRRTPLQVLTLTELRTSLFCTYRTICLDGGRSADDLPRMRSLVREIRDRVERKAFD